MAFVEFCEMGLDSSVFNRERRERDMRLGECWQHKRIEMRIWRAYLSSYPPYKLYKSPLINLPLNLDRK